MSMNDLNFNQKNINRSIAQFQLRTGKRDRYRIYRKLEGMLRMNEALSRALDRLYQNASEMGKHPNRPAAQALREWFVKDRQGLGLADAMEGWVPDNELALIRAGEESGAMAKAMSSIQKVGARASEMRSAVSYAIAYPAFMMILVSFVLYMFGVNLIQNMRATAPPKVVAKMGGVAAVSDFIANWGVFTLISIVAFCFFLVWLMPRWTGKTRSKFDMYAPFSWYRAVQGSAFLLGLSALLGAQVPLKRALEILEEQANPWMKERVFHARQEVLRGRNLGEALRMGGYNFPDPMVAIDLEILAERSDVGSVIEDVTDEWIEEQIDMLKRQAAVARNLGLVAVGGTIAWSMQSVFAVVTEVASGGM